MLFFIFEKATFFLVNIIIILLCIAVFTLIERKVMASVQRRKGPNLTGFMGFSQPIADGLKLFSKEFIIPSNSNLTLFMLSPVITLFLTFFIFFLIPIVPCYNTLSTPYSTIFLLVLSSLSLHGIIFSGWSSNSKYSFLGSIRTASQMVSYEICMSTIFLCIALMSGSFCFNNIIFSQYNLWFIIPLFPLWVFFLIIALAETNRAPFDLPEAEAELVAGYNVEYSAIAFAMFFLAEYGNIIIISIASTSFFFGGWSFGTFSSIGIGLLIFSIKVNLHIYFFLIVRAAFPRYRYDHLMDLCWKYFIPISFFLIMLQATIMLSFSIFPPCT